MSAEDLDREDWDLAGLLDATRDAWAEDLHTALPGRVESYDASAQVADVTPLVRRVLRRNDGSRVASPMPTIRAVPIAWPRAGDWFVHMPLAAGDVVLLVFCERDFARWRATGEISDPIDTRQHHLAHAIAYPGVYPRTRPITDVPTDAMVIGRMGGATIRLQSDGQVHVAGAAKLTLSDELQQHLSAIAQGLDTLAALISSGAIESHYGVAAKAALDAAHPIGTTNTRGS